MQIQKSPLISQITNDYIKIKVVPASKSAADITIVTLPFLP
jgi:hypothetical protein